MKETTTTDQFLFVIGITVTKSPGLIPMSRRSVGT